ncbi:MAG TPA: Calx-beta domain-containing protein [Acidimicrobiales bacterium]|nr:Calx-beta domain-containing protein [Acidimicrobiales bacterium]
MTIRRPSSLSALFARFGAAASVHRVQVLGVLLGVGLLAAAIFGGVFLQNPATVGYVGQCGGYYGYGYNTTGPSTPPTVTISGASVAEGDSGPTNQTFTVSLSTATCAEVRVTATASAPAASATGSGGERPANGGPSGPANPNDFTPTQQVVVFPAGTTTREFDVPVSGDTIDEPNEFYTVTLSDPENATLGEPASNQGTILDDDGAPALSLTAPSQVEGNAGTTNFDFEVSLLPASSKTVTVTFNTSDGTAVAGQDYQTTTQSLTFLPNETSKTVSVPVTGETVVESNESFEGVLSNSANASISTASAIATIVNDDGSGSGNTPSEGFGYRFVAADGGVFTFGDRSFQGSLGDRRLNKPIVGGATNPATFNGYWMVASDGGVFTFGDAGFFGSLAGTTLTSPIVEIEPTPTGRGYLLVDSAGRVFAFGDAVNVGDSRSIALNKPVIGMTVTPSGKGYFLVASDGGIFAFGDATFLGSMGDKRLNAPVIDLALTPDGNGYYLLGADGGIFSFGNAEFKGSTGDIKLNKPAVAMLVTPNGSGYWIVASDGGVFTFGPVPFLGSMGGTTLNSPVLDAIH